MIELLRDNPLLLLFVIAAIGWPLGRIQIGGGRLGVAAVLFTGLAVGALNPELRLPEIVYILGLVLFVYTVGLSSGSSFFASLRRRGLRNNLFVVTVLLVAAGLSATAYRLLNLQPTEAAGLFSGSLTNTPALAGALEFLKANVSPGLLETVLAEPVVAYSIAYPIGVLGMMLAVSLAQRLWRIDYRREAKRAGAFDLKLDNRTVRVTRAAAAKTQLSKLVQEHGWRVVFGRIQHKGQLGLADPRSRLHLGDLVTVVGPPDQLEIVTEYLGEISRQRIDLEHSEIDYRRLFVSNPRLAGRRLKDLQLPRKHGAVITRIRRGDVYLIPNGETILELGDRVRVLAQRDQLGAVTELLGDSYRAVSEIDVLSLGLGLALGTLLGLVPIPLPGGLTLRLGLAGGPLIAALVLGAISRTGPFLWNLPYSANLTLRQFGLVLFLAGVGSRAGYTFFTTLVQGNGLSLFVSGAVITFITALLFLWMGYRRLKIPMSVLTGMLAGLQTQPALLSFAADQSGDELPNVGYASVYPVATIAKIILAQVLLAWLM
ncbi:MAG: aspartate:alanine exchanger family transporter [Anaerolineales bacterium]